METVTAEPQVAPHPVIRLTWNNVLNLITARLPKGLNVYGVPRGGAVVAGLCIRNNACVVVDDPANADVIVDDIIDSGRTKAKFKEKYPDKTFAALIDKEPGDRNWYVFPWEEELEHDAEDTVVRMLEQIGEDPKREGLLDTPKRVVKSWSELFAGYKQDPTPLLQTQFTSEECDEMILCKNIEFYSTCEHHLQPFFGHAHVAYIPTGRVVGLSKLARLVDVFARRLQIQERLTHQIASSLLAGTTAKGVGVVVEAKHFCMICRGVRKQNSTMQTSALLGCFRDPAVRAEFFSLLRG